MSNTAKPCVAEAILEQIKNLSELELAELLEQIHDHCVRNEMDHIFQPFYDDSERVDDLIDEVLSCEERIRELEFDKRVLMDNTELGCKCTPEEKHGWTTIKCCNHCGKPTEEFWTKKTIA